MVGGPLVAKITVNGFVAPTVQVSIGFISYVPARYAVARVAVDVNVVFGTPSAIAGMQH